MKKTKQNALAEDFDFSAYRQEVIEGLIAGRGLTGEGGLLKPLIANFIEPPLSAEMDDHLLGDRSNGLSNKRNGQQSKQVRSESGDIEISYSRNRNGTFDPVTVRKRQHELGLGFDNQSCMR